MLIDGFTIAAQALNFLILVMLMKRFLYKPVLDAIAARETRIAAELADADLKKAQAQQDRDALKQKNEAFDQQRAALMSQAQQDADATRQQLLDAARRAADALAETRQQALDAEAKQLGRTMARRAQAEVFAIARQALSDLAAASLEASVCEVFIARLRALDSSSRDGFIQALRGSNNAVLVRTAFELPAAQRAALRQAIGDMFSAIVTLRYETAPDLVCGIEMDVQGLKFAWSIADYLGSLDRSVTALLASHAATPVAAGPAAASPVAAETGAQPAPEPLPA